MQLAFSVAIKGVRFLEHEKSKFEAATTVFAKLEPKSQADAKIGVVLL